MLDKKTQKDYIKRLAYDSTLFMLETAKVLDKVGPDSCTKDG